MFVSSFLNSTCYIIFIQLAYISVLHIRSQRHLLRGCWNADVYFFILWLTLLIVYRCCEYALFAFYSGTGSSVLVAKLRMRDLEPFGAPAILMENECRYGESHKTWDEHWDGPSFDQRVPVQPPCAWVDLQFLEWSSPSCSAYDSSSWLDLGTTQPNTAVKHPNHRENRRRPLSKPWSPSRPLIIRLANFLVSSMTSLWLWAAFSSISLIASFWIWHCS